MNSFEFSTLKTGRVYTLEPSGPVHEAWFVLHGYGQLGQYFIRHFAPLADDHTLVVAPEALHRFYLEGVYGRVGASWMTKEARESDIHDYVRYLDGVYREVQNRFDLSEAKITALGFSQGSATVCRWLAGRNSMAHQLILWAGAMPPDMNFVVDRALFNRLNIRFVMGTRDQFADSRVVQQHRDFLDEKDIRYTFWSFEGKHEIPPEVLLKVAGRAS